MLETYLNTPSSSQEDKRLLNHDLDIVRSHTNSTKASQTGAEKILGSKTFRQSKFFKSSEDKKYNHKIK